MLASLVVVVSVSTTLLSMRSSTLLNFVSSHASVENVTLVPYVAVPEGLALMGSIKGLVLSDAPGIEKFTAVLVWF